MGRRFHGKGVGKRVYIQRAVAVGIERVWTRRWTFSKRFIRRSWETYGASQLRKLGIDGIVSLHWRFSIDDDPVPEWVSLLEFKRQFKGINMRDRIYIDLAVNVSPIASSFQLTLFPSHSCSPLLLWTYP